MSWTKTNQLHALLAIPAPLRSILVGAPNRLRLNFTYIPTTNLRRYASSKNRKGDVTKVAAFKIPEATGLPIEHVSHEELQKYFSVPAAPKFPLDRGLKFLFTFNRPTLFDATQDFYTLKRNPCLPEICIFGRSNVGKSSLVNGIGHVFRSGLAPVSRKAGRTKTITTYGFGPPLSDRYLDTQAPDVKDYGKADQFSLFIVDMPGYGLNSLKHWGDNIVLYMQKRKTLRGVVVCIDGVIGPKATDVQLLEILCSLELRTAIVLTKVDKAGVWVNRLRLTVRALQNAIRNVKSKQVEKNWPVDHYVYATACDANDTQLLHSTLTTARVVVGRLAGMVTDDRPEIDRNQKWNGKIISFEDLKLGHNNYLPSNMLNSLATGGSPKNSNTPGKPENTGNTYTPPVSPFALLEEASARQYSLDPRATRLKTMPRGMIVPTHSRIGSRQGHRRQFHTSVTRPRDHRLLSQLPKQSGRKSPTANPLNETPRDVFDLFIDDLKSKGTRANYARNVRDQYDRRRPKPMRRPDLIEVVAKRAQRLESVYPDESKRTKKVKQKRLSIEEEFDRIDLPSRPTQAKRKGRAEAKALPNNDDEWSAMPPPSRKNKASGISDGIMTPDLFKSMVTSTDPDPLPETKESNKKGKRGKGKGKGKGKNAKPEKKPKKPEPVDPFEAKFGQAFSTSKKTIHRSSSF